MSDTTSPEALEPEIPVHETISEDVKRCAVIKTTAISICAVMALIGVMVLFSTSIYGAFVVSVPLSIFLALFLIKEINKAESTPNMKLSLLHIWRYFQY